MAKKHTGICKLTGSHGKFVESHILPKALTRPERPGVPFTQAGSGRRPVRRWSSWTDTRLVTREGEDILRDLDTWAIGSLRRNQLVWSGWDGAHRLPAEEVVRLNEHWGFRIVSGIDPAKLRLFLLSLLWRAAASKTPEMHEITVPDNDLEQMRSLIHAGQPGPLAFYPACLTQISTIGRRHNQTPIRMVKTIPAITPEMEELQIPIFRFYLDGLIVHFHIQSSDEGYTSALGSLIAGAADETSVTLVTYEASFQAENLLRNMTAAETHFPEVVERLAWPPL